MSTNDNGPGGPGASAMAGQADPNAPQLNCLAQYIKDFSFENPNAPRALVQMQTAPQVNVQILVNANPLSDTEIEVIIGLEGKADSGDTLLYNFELSFAGVFRILNIPPETVQQIVMVDCPHLLFPFAREIIASAVSNSGYPPLLIGPINFFGLYQQRLAEAAAQPGAVPPNAN